MLLWICPGLEIASYNAPYTPQPDYRGWVCIIISKEIEIRKVKRRGVCAALIY